MKDLMLDIETLGTRPTSVITQIGACYFDRNTGEIGDEFCKNINIGISLMIGLTVDEETINWWRQQRWQTWYVDCEQPFNVLNSFSNFTNRGKKINSVWCHASFDAPILFHAYSKCDVPKPFHYRAIKDIRTLVDLSGLDFRKKKDEKTHNALEDCIYQVKYCVECFNKLKENK